VAAGAADADEGHGGATEVVVAGKQPTSVPLGRVTGGLSR
jgi:hypothetical protein